MPIYLAMKIVRSGPHVVPGKPGTHGGSRGERPTPYFVVSGKPGTHGARDARRAHAKIAIPVHPYLAIPVHPNLAIPAHPNLIPTWRPDAVTCHPEHFLCHSCRC